MQDLLDCILNSKTPTPKFIKALELVADLKDFRLLFTAISPSDHSISYAERLVAFLGSLGERQQLYESLLFQQLLLFCTSSSELCHIISQEKAPEYVFNAILNADLSCSVRIQFMRSFSKILLFSERFVEVDFYSLLDLLFIDSVDDVQEWIRQIVQICYVYSFHYYSFKQQQVSIAEYKNVTKLFKFIIHSIGNSTAVASDSLNFITLLASISLNSSVGIKFFSFSNVEMCLKLLASVFVRNESVQLKMNGIFLLIFLVGGMNSTAIRNILQSLEGSIYEILFAGFVEQEIECFDVLVLLFKLIRLMKRANFAFTSKILANSYFISTLVKWINGFGLECIYTCKFIADVYDEIPTEIQQAVEILCFDFEFLKQIYVSPDCKLFLSISKSIYSLYFKIVPFSKNFIVFDEGLDFLHSHLKSNDSLELIDCCLFSLILNAFQLVPSVSQLAQSVRKISANPKLSQIFHVTLTQSKNDFYIGSALKNIIYFSQENPHWFRDFCKQYKKGIERNERIEKAFSNVTNERNEFISLFNESVLFENEKVASLADVFEMYSKNITILKEQLKDKDGLLKNTNDQLKKKDDQMEALLLNYDEFQSESKKETSKLKEMVSLLTSENHSMKESIEKLEAQLNELQKEMQQKETDFFQKVTKQKDIVQEYVTKNDLLIDQLKKIINLKE